MSHRPRAGIDEMGYLGLDPSRNVDFLMESKTNNLYYIKPPNWDSPEDTIELMSIQNEREYDIMLRLQNELRHDADIQSEINANRIREITEVQNRLQLRFAKVNFFMKDCDDKKSRALQKVAEERLKHEHSKNLINKYTKDMVELTQFRKDISSTVKSYEAYETVISEAVNTLGTFTSVKDCTDRCDALMLVQTEVTTMQKAKLDEIDAIRQEMSKAAKEAAITVLGFINELSQLEKDFEHARLECLKWEKVLSNVKTCIQENELSKRRIVEGIHLMFHTLCHFRGIELNFKGCEEQLDFIRDEIRFLQSVLNDCKIRPSPSKILL